MNSAVFVLIIGIYCLFNEASAFIDPLLANRQVPKSQLFCSLDNNAHKLFRTSSLSRVCISDDIVQHTAECAAVALNRRSINDPDAMNEMRKYLIEAALGKLFIYLKKCHNVEKNPQNIFRFVNCYLIQLSMEKRSNFLTPNETHHTDVKLN